MKFIVDAQLPQKLSFLINELGFDCIHTLDLVEKNATDDEIIRNITISESRILITKDSDFEDSFLLRNIPQKLLLITTGNIPNRDLLALFATNFNEIVFLFDTNNFIEIDREEITVHS